MRISHIRCLSDWFGEVIGFVVAGIIIEVLY